MALETIEEEPGCHGNKHSINGGHKQSESEDKQQNLLLAATLVQDAVKGHNMVYMTDAQSIRSYKLYNHPALTLFLQFCIWGNLFLAIFEEPAVQGVALPFWGTMLIEGIFIIFILCRLIHNSSFAGSTEFWKDPKNLIVIGTVVIRKAFRNIRRSLPDIFYVLLLFMASIAIFALLALKLMLKRNLYYPDGKPYFTNYFESFWDLYVLVTTANNPDVMMPAYDESKWFAIFFTFYTIINLYVFMNVVLAVIYNNYKAHLKNEVKSNVYMKRQFLSRAFNMIKDWIDGHYVVSEAKWKELMAVVSPKMAPEHIDLLLCVLDDQGNRSIRKNEFLRVGDLLNVELKEVRLDDSNVFGRAFPTLYKSRISELMRFAINSKYFQWAFDILILINAFCIGFNINEAEWFFLAAFTLEIILTLYAQGPLKYFTRLWNLFDFAIINLSLLVTLLDSLLGNVDSRTRSLDVLLVLRILRLVRLMGSFPRFRIILETIVSIGPSIATYGGIIFVIFYVYAIVGMEIFQGMIQFYGYQNLTEEQLFCGNQKLEGSEFYIKRYCNNNFNDVFHAMVVLFELMVVNQWHVLAEGFVLVTNMAARLYFITFHMSCVIITLNIFTAFVLEVFILRFTFSKSSLQMSVEQRIRDLGLGMGQKAKIHVKKKKIEKDILVENMQTIEEGVSSTSCDLSSSNEAEKGVGLRFKLKDRGSVNVETLLQLMFEGELESGDEGLDYDENEETRSERSKSLTIDSVL